MRLLAAALLVLAPSSALAAVERYALLVGSNAGAADEVTLRYAESDAMKLAEVLIDLGGFLPENVTVLRSADATSMRRALIALNERIRTRMADPAVEPLLLVYYSGHADASGLHLAGTHLELAEVEQLVRGSAAAFRLLLLDACRSGALTQVKGGTSAPPFAIHLEERLAAEGVVLLTSSAAGEDAQESDELKGSFFTHYLVSGLLGAADTNGDGKVGLREAYAYAYESTLRASSRTLAGTQHPTFREERSGKGDVVLTIPAEASSRRATLSLPDGRAYVILSGNAEGPVVAEVGLEDRVRRVSLKPGRYFVRSRARDHLLEGYVELAAGKVSDAGVTPLERIEYARLVRKGTGMIAVVHGPQAGYRVRTPLWSGASPCHGAFAGYALDFEALTVTPRAGACRSGFANTELSADAFEVDLELRVGRVFDLPLVSLELGVGAGGGILHEAFTTAGMAPARTTAAATLGAGGAVTVDVGLGVYLSADAEVLAYFFRGLRADGTEAITPTVAGRFAFGAGKRF